MDQTNAISQLPAGAFETAVLAVATLAVAWPSARSSKARPVRLAASFLIPIFLLVPPPAGALLCAAIAVTGLGAGLAGPGDGGRSSVLGIACAGALVQTLAMMLPPAWILDPQARAILLALLFVAFHAITWGVAAGLGLLGGSRGWSGWGGSPRLALWELGNIPLAWLLDETIRSARQADFLIITSTAIVAGLWSARYAASRHAARRADRALANRSAELAVLQSLAREILTSVDLDRLYRVIERECRKIFRCDFFVLATVSRETGEIRATYRSLSDPDPRSAQFDPDDGLISWVVRERERLRVDDFREPEASPDFHPRIVDPAVRSGIAVPLLVDGRAVGVISVQSRAPGAYEDHHLNLLETIGHQAAAAIENARQYERATTDSLTGLLARDVFFVRVEEEYQRALRYNLSFALLMLDIDRFKEVNDRHGHPTGDKYLQAFGGAIRRTLRAADLASRYGGDEFCLLLPETDLSAARRIAERLRGSLAALQVEAGTFVLRATVSIGIAAFPNHDGGDVRTLLLRADQALYRAKRDGRNRVIPFAA
jgi:diguanylate cyclase (GGDEF)-like protein